MRDDQYEIHTQVDQVHWWWRARRAILRDVIREYAPRLPREQLVAAEVGCAAGGNLPMLAECAGQVYGCDAHPEAIASLQGLDLPNVEVLQLRIPEPLPRPCHVLCLLDVLEHLDDDEGAMRWAAQQLLPGGVAVITVPAFQLLWSEQDEVVEHRRRYTPESLRALVGPELEIEQLTCFNSVLFPPILAARLGMRLLRDRSRPPRSHLGSPPAPINALLYRLFLLERHLVVRHRLPLGVSVLMVARRRPDPPGTPPPAAG